MPRRSDAELAADFRNPWVRLGWLTGQLRDARDTLLEVERSLAGHDRDYLLGLVQIDVDGINRALALANAADLGAGELRARNDRAAWSGYLLRLANDDPLPGELDTERAA